MLAKASKKLYKSVLKCNEAGNKYGPFYFKRLNQVLPHYRNAFDKTPKLEGGKGYTIPINSKGTEELARCFKPEQIKTLSASFRMAGQKSLDSKDFKHAYECFLHAFKLASDDYLPLMLQDGFKAAFASINMGKHQVAIEQIEELFQIWLSQPDALADKALYQAITARLFALKGAAHVYLAMTFSSGTNMQVGGEKSFDGPLKVAKDCYKKALELDPNNLHYKIHLKMIKSLCYGAEYGNPHKDLKSTNDSFPIVKMLDGVRKHLKDNSTYTTVTYSSIPQWYYDQNLKTSNFTYTHIPHYHTHQVPINYKLLIDLDKIKAQQGVGKKNKTPKLPAFNQGVLETVGKAVKK